jgi:flavorubredoxin
MPDTILFENGTHRNILLADCDVGGLAVQTNQHLIQDGAEAMILDPGGHKVYAKVLSATFAAIGKAHLKHIFLSHQDPDIVAAVNGWLMTTDATAHVSGLWTRFVPHFGLDRLVETRLLPIPDEGRVLQLGATRLSLVPAHFLHSPGNFHLYDPVSRILYTGDLGASIGAPYIEVTDFDAHLQYIEGFHRRYMSSRRALRVWVRMAKQLDVQMIVPQHGAFYRGPALVSRFIEWCENLECGSDLLRVLRVPT